MDNISFVCKNCGFETFKTTSEPKTLEDFYGAVCAKCGTAITEDDIKAQARKVADDLVRDAVRKAGFKKFH